MSATADSWPQFYGPELSDHRNSVREPSVSMKLALLAFDKFLSLYLYM